MNYTYLKGHHWSLIFENDFKGHHWSLVFENDFKGHHRFVVYINVVRVTTRETFELIE